MGVLVIVLFFIGIILALVGYYQNNQNCPIQKTKYKFLPRTVEEDQAYNTSVYEIFQGMFTQPPILS